MSQESGYSFGHSMDIDERVALANGRLKSSRVGLSIERRGGTLWLPDESVLTADLLKDMVARVQEGNPNSRQRRFALTLERLRRFAGLDVDFSHLRGSYSAGEVGPRDVPGDVN